MCTRALVLAFFVSASLVACAPRGERVVVAMAQREPGPDAIDVPVLRAEGEALFAGRGGCHTCHRVDDRGTRYTGPNLGIDPLCATDPTSLTARDPVACLPLSQRASARHAGRTPIEYALESILDPDLVVTPTYAKSVMKRQDLPPVSLTDREVLALATYVATLRTPAGLTASMPDLAAFMDATRRARDLRLEAAPPH